jgi:hypothetical protein
MQFGISNFFFKKTFSNEFFFLSYPKKPDPDPDENLRIAFIESKKKVFLGKSSRKTKNAIWIFYFFFKKTFSNEFFF